MKILITGATGFLGRRLVEALVSHHELRLLARSPMALTDFADRCEILAGDIGDAAAVDRAVAGCDRVVHAAALVKILAPAAEFDRTNLGGLNHVLAAIARHGVARTVYVSSFMALGPSEQGPQGILDETAPVAARRWINDYERTKTLADLAARDAMARGVPLDVVYPGVIYGPGELTEGNIVVRHLLDLAHGRLPALLGQKERRWNYVLVDDVVAGIRRLVESDGNPAPGERYILGGENVRQDDFYREVAAQGIKVPKFRMPFPVATASGMAMKAWAQLVGGTPRLTPDLVEVYRHDWAYDSAKAIARLGYRPRTFAAGLAETCAWLRQTGALPR